MQRTRNWTMILAFPLILVAITTCQLAITGDAMALFYNQNVTNAVIFGSGNNNGSFTVDRASGVELGLRGKLRFDENGYPQNVFNSNGDGTYTFSIGAAPGGASWVTSTTPIWSFEWSINSNYDGNGQFLNGFTYVLGIDFDPGIGITNWLTFDPINGYPYFDHSIGDNSTAEGAGMVASDSAGYLSLLASNNLAQNSWNMEFYNDSPYDIFDPTVGGEYDFYLAAFNTRDGQQVQVARTDIQILVTAPVPEPGTIALLGVGLLGLGVLGRKRLMKK